jgi:hypothetical protein
MRFDQNDEKLESYLRKFRPQQPRNLPRPIARRQRALAIAAVAALFLIVIWIRGGRHKPVESQPVAGAFANDVVRETSLGSLSRIVRDDPDNLGAHLDKLSPRLLPDVRHSGGFLKKLAQE